VSAAWRPKQFVRPVAIAVINRDFEFLLTPVHTDHGEVKGWRPLGGEIEFGETAAKALARELYEESGEMVLVGKHLGVFENIYQHENAIGHEIIFAFEVRFKSSAAYEKAQFAFVDGNVSCTATWIDLRQLHNQKTQLYPEGLLKLLAFSP
jgi:ADP-ribose pyrophosphatase YjhB (NUDIX family)